MPGPDVPSSARLHYDGIGQDNDATILPAERGSIIGPTEGRGGRNSRNAFAEPSRFQTGRTGELGGNDPMNDEYEDRD